LPGLVVQNAEMSMATVSHRTLSGTKEKEGTNIVLRTKLQTANLRAKLDHITGLLNENLPGSFDMVSLQLSQFPVTAVTIL
jgi:hypothetical protein